MDEKLLRKVFAEMLAPIQQQLDNIQAQLNKSPRWEQGQEPPEEIKRSREQILHSTWKPPYSYAYEGQKKHGKEYMKRAIQSVLNSESED